MADNMQALLLLADGALASGDFETAANLFADAETAATEPLLQAQAAHGLACALRAAGEFAAAYSHADRAMDLLPEGFDGALLGQIRLSRSLCLCELGQPKDAEHGFRMAAETFSRNDLSADHAQARIGLGWSLALQERDGDAAAVFASLTSHAHPLIQSQALNNLAIMRERAGSFAESAALLERDLVLARSLSDEHGQVVTQINLSRVLLAAGRTADARDVAVAALALADRSPVSRGLKQRAADAVATAK